MRKTIARPLIVVLVIAFAASGSALAEGEEPTLVPETERVLFSTGCDQGAGGTCDTTQYWLGLTPGGSSVGTIPQTVTPWNWAFSAAGNDIVYAEYAGNNELAPTYTLRADEPIAGRIQTQGYQGPTVSADSTVTVELRAQRQTPTGGWQSTTLGTAAVNQTLVAGTAAAVYEFELALPETRQGEVIRNLNATLYFKGIHVLTNGFVNGQGGSWFDLPHLVEG